MWAWCNNAVHEAPWTDGDLRGHGRGGLFIALELAEQAYAAHSFPYTPGVSHMHLFDPRRFTWVYDATGEAADCVKVKDNQTGRLALWPHF
jgi:hypothetical protein